MEAPGLLDPADERPGARAALRAWLDLQHQLRLQPQRAAELLRRWGDPVTALHRAGCPAASSAALDAGTAALRRCGAIGLPLLSPAYPERLAQLRDPAPLLWVCGDASALAAPGVAVVGSRAATAYGLRAARRIAGDLARAGLVVISGLARGIDAAAHGAALDAGGRTLAFLACGPDRVYPPEHRRLAARVARSGALLTEHPPGTPPLPGYFPLRNRLLAASALALVVVEARERSGSLVTASHAAALDVDVFAVPGPVDAATSAGTNRLLFEGAFVARGAEDVVSRLAQHGSWRAPPVAPGPELAAPQRAIVEALSQAPATRDELARRLGRAAETLALELLELELAGLVGEDRDGRLRVL